MENSPRYGVLYEKRRHRLREDARARLKGTNAKSLRGVVERAAELAGDLTKLIAALSALSAGAGIVLLVAYLRSEGAPFPFIDSSLIVFLTLIAVAFVFLFAVGAFLLLLPAFLKGIIPLISLEETRAALPGLFAEGSGFKRFKRYFCDYLRVFAPFLLSALVIALFVLLDHLQHGKWLVVSLLISTLAGACIVRCFTQSWKLFGESVQVSVFALLWLFALPQIVIAELGEPFPQAYLWRAILLVALVVLHFFLNLGTARRWIGGLSAVVMLCIIFVYPGPASDARAVLRFLGLGGGTPATVLVKPMGTGSSQRAAEEVNGCLIIGVGSEILIRLACCREECSSSPSSPPATYRNVQRFARSDVLRVSEFHDQPCPKK